MKDRLNESRPYSQTGSRQGMTLVEVCIAMALVALACGGLYAVGIKSRQFAEHNRTAMESRSLAKERLEEMIALGAEKLAGSITRTDTNFTSMGDEVVRQPRLVWHKADGTVGASTNAAYVEAHVDVTYRSPLTKAPVTDSYSMIIEK